MSERPTFRDYVESGVSVVPLMTDGSKRPCVSWNKYREQFATPSELFYWSGQNCGIAIVCGRISGGVEVLDFDEQPDETLDRWIADIPSEIFSRLCIVQTGSGGYHVIYRSSVVTRNAKIALRDEGGVLIESRGEGGYVVAVGSPSGVHKSGVLYTQVQGEPLPAIPTLTPEERKVLWVSAAKLDQRADPFEEYRRKAKQRSSQPIDLDTSTPWGDFDANADWEDILFEHGWSSTNGITWTRPGKRFGSSAKVVKAKDGSMVLTVFSANAGPLAARTSAYRTWGKFAAYCQLNHAGDRRAAARSVRALGFGR